MFSIEIDTDRMRQSVKLTVFREANAGIAQLVERDVANVKVAGSNPVSRSIFFNIKAQLQFQSLSHRLSI